MTAIWHQQQLEIEHGNLDYLEFINGLVTYIGEQVEYVKSNGVTGLNIKAYACPNCGKVLRRIKGQKGYFWGCTGFKDGCKTALRDVNNKPVAPNPAESKPSDIYKCSECQSGLIRRKGKGKPFWGCSDYPTCKTTYPDSKGRPVYKTKKVTSND